MACSMVGSGRRKSTRSCETTSSSAASGRAGIAGAGESAHHPFANGKMDGDQRRRRGWDRMSANSYRRAVAAGASLVAISLAGCNSASNPIPMETPTAQSIAGLTPSGRVTMSQVFVSGVGVGKGTLTFKGQSYPFRILGTVVGYGSLSKADVSGEVYKLDDISQFSGVWVEG